MKHDGPEMQEIFDADGRRNLGLVLIHCAGPLLQHDRLQAALTVLACVKILTPQCDVRHVQALTFYCMDDYLEALQLLQGLDHMPARALAALCQRAIGEPSWLGLADQVCESSDEGAIALLAPWMQGAMGVRTAEAAGTAPCTFTPMRA